MTSKTIPRNRRKLYEEAMAGRSRKNAIKFFCLECCGFEYSEVKQCTAKDCVLYKFRLSG